ncbi:MAG: hypothetical protein V1791_04560 [Pseudomonadota bacterium]
MKSDCLHRRDCAFNRGIRGAGGSGLHELVSDQPGGRKSRKFKMKTRIILIVILLIAIPLTALPTAAVGQAAAPLGEPTPTLAPTGTPAPTDEPPGTTVPPCLDCIQPTPPPMDWWIRYIREEVDNYYGWCILNVAPLGCVKVQQLDDYTFTAPDGADIDAFMGFFYTGDHRGTYFGALRMSQGDGYGCTPGDEMCYERLGYPRVDSGGVYRIYRVNTLVEIATIEIHYSNYTPPVMRYVYLPLVEMLEER